MIKILNINYANVDLTQIADNATHIKSEEITQLFMLLEDFEDLFYGTLGDWATEPVELELKPVSNLFNSKYYPVPRINKETFHKDLKRLLEIGVSTPVQQNK